MPINIASVIPKCTSPSINHIRIKPVTKIKPITDLSNTHIAIEQRTLQTDAIVIANDRKQ